MRERLPLLIGLTLLSIAILLGSVAIARGIRDRNQNNVISVTGSAKQRITSDYAIWDLAITSQQDTAAGAARQLAVWTKTIRGFLGAHGVQPSELSMQPVSTQTVNPVSNNGASSSQVIGYQLTRNFEVRSARVGAVASVAEASSGLIASGVPISAQPLQYIYTRLAGLRPQLIAAATKDAQARAAVLIAATGGKLGKLRSVDVGVFQVTSPNSTAVSDYGEYDTSTLKKDVTAVVNVAFALH